ncbi:MAG: BON domain-containing protein [Caldilineaceae bacterium]|nr:BON domain-containing protein [Caldilineaceae bacterium]
MVRIHHKTSDPQMAWRVRDALACHPLLGGAMAQISVTARRDAVILQGWVADDDLKRTAIRLTTQVAGRRPLYIELHEQPPRTTGRRNEGLNEARNGQPPEAAVFPCR